MVRNAHILRVPSYRFCFASRTYNWWRNLEALRLVQERHRDNDTKKRVSSLVAELKCQGAWWTKWPAGRRDKSCKHKNRANRINELVWFGGRSRDRSDYNKLNRNYSCNSNTDQKVVLERKSTQFPYKIRVHWYGVKTFKNDPLISSLQRWNSHHSKKGNAQSSFSIRTLLSSNPFNRNLCITKRLEQSTTNSFREPECNQRS